MICTRQGCKGLMVKEYDHGYPRHFHIYQDRCLNCGHVMFDPKTVDHSEPRNLRERDVLDSDILAILNLRQDSPPLV